MTRAERLEGQPDCDGRLLFQVFPPFPPEIGWRWYGMDMNIAISRSFAETKAA